MTSHAESLYRQINHFISGSASGLLQLLVAAAQRTTFDRIIVCPTYPAPAWTSGLSLAIQQLREATSCSDVHLPTFLARLYASTRVLQHRKTAGQFFTPGTVAEWALALEPPRINDDVLDAGSGTAVFADALVRTRRPVRSYVGVENDAILVLCAAHVLDSINAPDTFKVWYANFLLLKEASFDKLGLRRPTLIIANPPFIRSHRLSGRARVLASIKANLGITLSHMAGSGSYFLSRAASLTEGSKSFTVDRRPTTRLLFFFPREAAGAAHARKLRQDLEQLHGWTWQEHVIPDAQTGIDKRPSNALALFFVFERKKVAVEPSVERSDAAVRVHDFLNIKRGISTGCNEFFVLNDEEVRHRKIPQHHLRAVLPTRIHIANTLLSESDWNQLRLSGHRCWLLSLPDRDLDAFEIPIREYIREGLRRGMHTTPTAQRLRTWFSLPIPSTPPDIFVTYFFRGAPRFILNGAKVLNLTNILAGRFTIPIKDGTCQQAIIDALNEQATCWMEKRMTGREYRGGLKKIEPRELSMLPIDPRIADLIIIRDQRAIPPVSGSLFD